MLTTTLLMLLGLLGGLLFAIGMYASAQPLIERKAEVAERIERFARPVVPSIDEMALQRPFHERMTTPFLKRCARLGAAFTPGHTLANIERKLTLAGLHDVSPTQFLAQRVAYALVGAGVGVAVAAVSGFAFPLALTPLASTLVGFYLPNLRLDAAVRRRMKAIRRQLPDAIDLLTISVDAGLPFDGAMIRMANKFKGPLAEEFRVALAEMQMGLSRREALQGIINRTALDDMTTFLTAVIQAESMGLPLTNTLRLQSRQMRVHRRLRAEKAAGQAPIKMTIPLVFLIFPAVFLIILGPMVPNLLSMLGGGL